MSEYRKPTRVSRETLYSQVWTTPVDRLAESYGISGRGLGKICARMDIPVPPRGYWARLAAGQKVAKFKLPSRKDGIPQEIDIASTPEAEPPKPLPDAVEASVKAESTNTKPLKITSTLSNPHPIVQHWIDENRRERSQYVPNGWSAKPPRIEDDPLQKRRLLILSALFKELEHRKYKPQAPNSYPREIYAEIQNQKVVFELDEYIRQVRQRLTPAEKAKSYNGKQEWKQEKVPTGLLRLRIKAPYGFHGYKTEWLDNEASKVEDHLVEILTTMTAAGALYAENARIKAEEDAKRRAEEHRRYEEERARKRDTVRWRHVLHMAGGWKDAQNAISLLDELEKRARERVAPEEIPEEELKWLRWAREKAEAVDPLNYRLSDIVALNTDINDYNYPEDRPSTYHSSGPPQQYPFWLRHR